MANAINRTVLINSSTNYVVLFTIIGDGSGDETNTRVNAITGDMGTNPKILHITSRLAGFSARLMWDATTKVFATQLIANNDDDQNYSKFGGIPDQGGAGKTGDILITTTSLGSLSGSFVLHVKK